MLAGDSGIADKAWKLQVLYASAHQRANACLSRSVAPVRHKGVRDEEEQQSSKAVSGNDYASAQQADPAVKLLGLQLCCGTDCTAA